MESSVCLLLSILFICTCQLSSFSFIASSTRGIYDQSRSSSVRATLSYLEDGKVVDSLQQQQQQQSVTTTSAENININEKIGIVLPTLTLDELQALHKGERIQKQERTGAKGNGLVVVDVLAPPSKVFRDLVQFERYTEMIPTVRSAEILTIKGGCTEVRCWIHTHTLS